MLEEMKDVVSLTVGQPDFITPWHIRAAGIESLEEGKTYYTSNAGTLELRVELSKYMLRRFGLSYAPKSEILVTVGGSEAIDLAIRALVSPGDEVILLAPFFPEYRVFVERTGARAITVLSDLETFQPDFAAIEAAINEKTRAIIINSPNNPTGAVLTEESIVRLTDLLSEKQKYFGAPIYLISDEPYRELVYGEIKVPYLTKYYNNTSVCYSFSKSVSLPGERIGYILVSSDAENRAALYVAVCGAGRAVGLVCAPALFQKLIPACLGKTSDLSVYQTNRDLLLEALTAYGFRMVSPDGAFYLFLKAPEADANAFAERAKGMELLLVPSDDFGWPGFVRISYCVSTEQIKRSLPAFKRLAESYGL
jgi:aspartate aminotransferase